MMEFGRLISIAAWEYPRYGDEVHVAASSKSKKNHRHWLVPLMKSTLSAAMCDTKTTVRFEAIHP